MLCLLGRVPRGGRSGTVINLKARSFLEDTEARGQEEGAVVAYVKAGGVTAPLQDGLWSRKISAWCRAGAERGQ